MSSNSTSNPTASTKDECSGQPISTIGYKKESIWCDPCKVSCNGAFAHKIHMEGVKHSRRVKELEMLDFLKLPFIVHYEESNTFACTLCPATLNALNQIGPHIEGQRHKSMVINSKIPLGLRKDKSNDTFPIPSHPCAPPAAPNLLYCSVCNIHLNSATQFDEHCSSKKHINKMTEAGAIYFKPPYWNWKTQCDGIAILPNGRIRETYKSDTNPRPDCEEISARSEQEAYNSHRYSSYMNPRPHYDEIRARSEQEDYNSHRYSSYLNPRHHYDEISPRSEQEAYNSHRYSSYMNPRPHYDEISAQSDHEAYYSHRYSMYMNPRPHYDEISARSDHEAYNSRMYRSYLHPRPHYDEKSVHPSKETHKSLRDSSYMHPRHSSNYISDRHYRPY